MKDTKKLVTAALLAAFTCVATMVIKIQTPTYGYIHLGDGLVLLCGIILGPCMGSLAAGIGSCFADIFSGYPAWAPATLIIKALTAFAAGLLFHKIQHLRRGKYMRTAAVVLGGIIGEFIMVMGYFLYEALLAGITNGSFNQVSISGGFASASAGIPFNIVQGVVGIIISVILLPILSQIEDVRTWISH